MPATGSATDVGSSLVDDKYKPKPLYDRLKQVIRGKWMTNVEATALEDGNIAFRGFHGEYQLTPRTGLGISSLTATCLNLLGYAAPADYDPSLVVFK